MCLLITFYSLLLSDSRFSRSRQTLQLLYDSKHKIEMSKVASECNRGYSIHSKKKSFKYQKCFHMKNYSNTKSVFVRNDEMVILTIIVGV